MFGRQCQMQCSRKYDIPAVGSGFTGIFTCSEKEGVFKPLNTVPNCTGKNSFETSVCECVCVWCVSVYIRKLCYILVFYSCINNYKPNVNANIFQCL